MDLVLEMQAFQGEFVKQASGHGALEYPGAGCSMNLQRALDHGVTRFVGTHDQPYLCVLRVLCVDGVEKAKQAEDRFRCQP
jgi:hypothetical protein